MIFTFWYLNHQIQTSTNNKLQELKFEIDRAKNEAISLNTTDLKILNLQKSTNFKINHINLLIFNTSYSINEILKSI
ncbi:MAG: hypothetical protein HC798_02150 [Polaribacter sp.]|nr:hypothetical protein [Polaribacter sp.]